MAGIYIHIPFCKRKCHYCDFYSCTALERRGELLAALKRELTAQRDYLGDEPLHTIYFGGGTPSVYAPADIQSLIDHIGSLWDCSQVGEVTMEANPDDLTAEYLGALAATDVNRLSIGIQSFADRDLRLMNRRHTAASAIEAVRNAQQAGFDNITIDLIYGIPGMSDEEWQANIRQALALGVQHISAYHLTIEEGTEFGRRKARGELSPIGEESSERQYATLHTMLTEAGFEHYEISNFALPDRRAAHNSSYWTGSKYLGIGPSAHSYDGVSRRWVAASLDDYIAGGELYETESLTPRDRYNEHIMTSLRRAEGVDLAILRAEFGERAADEFASAAEKFVCNGSLKLAEGRYFIPAEYFLVSDAIISELFLTD